MFNRWIKLKKPNALLIGPRRAGKSTFLKSQFPSFQYVTLDDLDFLTMAKKDPKGFVNSLNPNAIIDEVQRFPQLTVAVKYAIDELNKKFILTGSSGVKLLDSGADTLAGRMDIWHLPTACWGENFGLPDHKIFKTRLSHLDRMEAHRKLDEAIIFGGFPEVLTKKSKSDKMEILRLYKNSYFTRDLAQLANIENIDGLLAILNHLARSLCSHLEVSNFSRESGLSYLTTHRYLNILNLSNLIFKVYGYHFGPAKRYIKAFKTYFADNGILTALGMKISEGQYFENFVISELEKRRKLRLINCDCLFYYKSVGGAEIDVIIETPQKIQIIEIKNSSVISTRDTTHLMTFVKNHKAKRPVEAYLIYRGTEYKTVGDVKCLPVASFFRGV